MASEDQLEAFLDGQTHLLKVERDAEIEQTSLLLSSCPPKLLERKGLALGGLSVASVGIGLGGKSLVELERPSGHHVSPVFPPHTFRPGDLARIEEHVASSPARKVAKKPTKSASANGASADNGVEGVVFKVTESKIVIVVDNSDSSDDLELPELCRVLKLANSVTYDRMDRAIDTVRRLVTSQENQHDAKRPDSNASLTPLIEILLGIKTPTFAPLKLPGDFKFLDNSLNLSQQSAVRFALESEEIALIHGPPGTGKTHTLIEIIRQLVLNGKRLLVCGASNLAVDNLLERLIPHKIPLTRLGHPARVLSSLHSETLDAQASRSDDSALAKDVKKELEDLMSTLTGKGGGKGGKAKIRGAERKKMWEEVRVLRKEYRKREGSVVKNVLSQAKVVLATCHSAGGRQLQNMIFDVVLIDEATQALEAVCWVPILRGKKLILAGDPLQLPPTIMSTNTSSSMKVTSSTIGQAPAIKGSKPTSSSSKARQASPKLGTLRLEDDDEDNSHDSEGDESSSDANSQTPKGNGVKISASKPKPRKMRTPTLRPSKSLEVTLFDRLEKMYGRRIKRMLRVQYRMHEKIATFPSKTLYKSKLISHGSVASHLLKDLPSIPSDLDKENIGDVLEHPVVFFDTAGCEFFERLDVDEGEGGKLGKIGAEEGSRCNENEGTLVKSWVEKLVQAGVMPFQIAVITPYQAQVTLLSSLLKATYPDLEIGTVDGMQGREKEAIVLSLVRSNDKREVGFLKEKRRMNVAMTRPRRHLCVIGDSATVSQGSSYLSDWMTWLEENADVRFGGDPS